jgi:membrane protein
MLLATSVIYWLIPGTKVRWHAVSPGSLFATTGWVGVTQGFRIYVENFARYNETYGALGGVVVLLVWLYLTGSLLLAGGQINAVIHRAAEEI